MQFQHIDVTDGHRAVELLARQAVNQSHLPGSLKPRTFQKDIDISLVCTVEDGMTHRFSYHLPGNTTPSERELGSLAQDLATFLRRELENRLGRMLLQSPTRPPSTEKGSLLF